MINKALGATRPDRRPFRRFWYSLEWLQIAALLALAVYVGAMLLR